MKAFDVAIKGDGAVARTLALVLARQGLRIALPLREPDAAGPPDIRAYALNRSSIHLLSETGVWEALADDSRTAVYDMSIDGDAGASLTFSAWQNQVGELAWIVDAGELLSRLGEQVRETPSITVTRDEVEAELTALAEGRASAARDALGVTMDVASYGQHGLATRLVSDQRHNGVARQWFRSPDVLALLPFDRPEPGRSYGLVWSLPDDRAAALLKLDDAGFESALADAVGPVAGRLKLAGERRSWPLALGTASRLCGPGWVLLGDAAHLVHPLAGQGLNLGLADVASLARVLAARETWRTIGEERLLRRYVRERAGPTQAMGLVTDGLLRLFAAEQPLVRELRNRGLNLVNHAAPLKRWLAAQALGR